MAVDENTSSSTGNLQDNLETVTGIGPRTAEALSRIGVHRLTDLAESTPDGLAKALKEAGLRITAKQIEAANWIGQARTLLQQARDEQVSPQQNPETEQKAVDTQPVEDTPQRTQWHQHAGFSVFFDYLPGEEGQQSWQAREWKTRVYHDETGAETEFPDLEPRPWINWILQEARLPGDAGADLVEPAITEPATTAPLATAPPATAPPATALPVTALPSTAGIEVLDVQVEPQPSDVRHRKLESAIQFTVTGANAAMLTADNTPYQIMIHTVDLGSGVTKLVASEHSQLQLEQAVYIHRLEFPIPDLGRYELQTIVLIQAQPELIATYRGPTINVTP